MKFFQKTWLLWFLIIPIILLNFRPVYSIFVKDGLEVVGLSFLLLFIYAPILFIIGLILNIRKNSSKNQPVSKDWKFWAWLVPLIIVFVVLIYILAHNTGLINF